MSTYAWMAADGAVELIESGIVTTLPSEDGDTPAHARLAAFLDDGGELADAPPPAPPMSAEELATSKQGLRAAIDAAAEAERLKYITGGAGQAMTYQRKLEEARMADSDVSPAAEDYPLLAASVGIEGADIAAVADLVIAMDAAWTSIGAAIEAARLGAKKAVTEAGDEAAARAVVAAIQWPTPPE